MTSDPKRGHKGPDGGPDGSLVALVIAGTMLAWMGAQWLGGQLGWEARLVFLFDFAALAAFLWALVATYRIWRRSR